jgi:hypothetical protein
MDTNLLCHGVCLAIGEGEVRCCWKNLIVNSKTGGMFSEFVDCIPRRHSSGAPKVQYCKSRIGLEVKVVFPC